MTRLFGTWKLRLIIAVSAVLTALTLFGMPVASAANPSTISFQGKVVNANGTNVTNGSYTFVFKLYTVSTGGTAVWTETDTGVTVTNGVFQENLGNSTTGCPLFTANACNNNTPISFYTDNSLYLGITFNSDPAGEMTPRVQFQSVPYASNADYLGGIASSGFVQLGATQSGNITITNGTFSGTLAVQGASALTLGTASTNSGAILFESSGGGNAITLQAPSTNPTSAYSLSLPTTAPALGQCLQNNNTTIGQLTFGSCGGSPTLQNIYDNSTTASITTSSSTKGVSIAAGSGLDSTALFSVQNAAGTSLLNVDSLDGIVGVKNADLTITGSLVTRPGSPAVSAGANSGGTLSGSSSTTYYYKVTAIVSGSETAPSTEFNINGNQFTPISAPSSAATGSVSSGGSLSTSSNYFYEYTYQTANGQTTVSPESATISTTNTKDTVTLTMTACPTGATNINVYRTAANGASGTEKLVTNNAGCTGSYTDTLADASLGATPPSSNTATTNTNNASLTWNAVSGASSYNIYRGTTSGGENAYQSSATNSFTDAGGAGTAGTPPTGLPASLGIGTTSPTVQLDVRGKVFFQTITDSTNALLMQDSTAAPVFDVDSLNGRVGIGTNAPTANLTFGGASTINMIQSSSGAGGALNIEAGQGATNSNGGNLILQAGAGAGTGITGSVVIEANGSDSTTALQVENHSGVSLLTVDTANSLIQIGSLGGSTQTNLALSQSSAYADTGTCGSSASSPNGALYYNTDTNAIRACIGGSWEDMTSTSGLGILLYGVVPDSGSVPGDLESKSTAGVSGPCKVSWASANSVTIQACSVYTGGRKITQATVTVTLPAMTANQFTHLCFYSGGVAAGPITNATSWFTTPSTTETANLPTFSATSPVICLATIKNSSTTANTIGQVYDTRVFNNSTKQFIYGSVALAPGWITIFTTTDTTRVTTTTTAATAGIAGVVAAGNTAAWASGGPNGILVTGGPVEIETAAGATSAYNYIETNSTAGYATTAVSPTATFALPNKYIGLAMTAYGSCSTPSASACQGSIYTQIQWID